ncbi:MAG: MBL fold metallo-hydrolase [Cyanobacteria bacterium J06641_5]
MMMHSSPNRRQLLRYLGLGALSAMGSAAMGKRLLAQEGNPAPQAPTPRAPAGEAIVRWLGHTCFWISGDGLRVLVNPFRRIGCTAGYERPEVPSDLVLISSQLFDEGGGVKTLDNLPQILFQPGSYDFQGIEFQGTSVDHDREGGRRFGKNIIWRWEMGGMRFAHLGGAAVPLSFEDKIVIGQADVVFLPVGGGPKAYNPEEAKEALSGLSARLIIPTHYRTQAAEDDCDIAGIDDFLSLFPGADIRRIGGDAVRLSPRILPAEGSQAFAVFDYPFPA